MRCWPDAVLFSVGCALAACGARSAVDLGSLAQAQAGTPAAGGHGGHSGAPITAGGSAMSAGAGGSSSAQAGSASGGASPACPTPLTACAEQCRDLSSDSQACGACDATCAADETCEQGSCVCEKPRLVRVTPPNARDGVSSAAAVIATYSCAPNADIERSSAMRMSGDFAAALGAAFPRPRDPKSVELLPSAPDSAGRQAYLPGELVTGWLGERLGGPFLWQFTAATRAKSSGTFQDTGQALTPATKPVLADLDHDGDLDLVTWSYGDPVRVWKNDGHGQFLLAATLSAATPSVTGPPVLGDFDGDGDLDVAVSTLFLNDGKLTFTRSVPLGIPRVAFDVDGDGDLDLLTSPTEQTWAVLKNDGKGHFTQTQMSQEFLSDAEVGDFDNDGDLDVVALTSLGQQRAVILLNDGTGSFEELDAGLMVNASRGLSVGDVDDDGDLDVFIGNWGQAGGFNPNDQVWLNDGTAHFSAGDAPLSGSVQIVLADVDGDGDLDAVAGQHVPYTSEKGEPSLVLLNDGTGHFSSTGQVGGSNFQNIALGDLDGDGDLDAVVAQWDWTLKPPVQIWLQSS